ncbi:FAD-dependent monooxygenase [Lichenihabitans sp. Uapishka_5]|uniref:FAD-dependent monooxygenase n=1 Tax=Lichenihabitans sp. Uapishka_5 TaxID=3037302 RepID=UPI0029E812D5|nr:FAD-dependent monooxygenase [Lichenihabitans sp. Uapishka_5]MDX7949660.1 FAD-dependent monooxygenase [Lichenihabitans sp. Uapishka_5]
MTHLAVAGAGIGGLAAALSLARVGLRVSLFERRPALAEFGAGLQLSPNATRVLSRLRLLEAVRAVALEPRSVRVRRSRDGAELIRFPLGDHAVVRYGAPFLLVLRRDLQRVLAEHASVEPAIRLVFGADVAGTSAKGVALAGQGEPFACDGFVDARGIATAAARDSGRIAWRALVPSARLGTTHRAPDTNLWLGPRTHLVHYPVPGGTHVNVVAITQASAATPSRSDDPWSRPGDPAALRHAFAGWHTEALQLLDPTAEWRCWRLRDAAPRARWSEGNMTVLGDAAHPMLPFLAQGASQAIEDAGSLAVCLAEGVSVVPAFAAYEHQRRDKAARVQQQSRRQGDIYHLGRPAADARDLAMRLLGGSRALARLDWLYGGS